MEAKFKTGDKVRIVNYGHLIWSWTEIKETATFKFIGQSENKMFWYDMCPERVEKEDVVLEVKETQDSWGYSLVNNGAWYSDKNLELIE